VQRDCGEALKKIQRAKLIDARSDDMGITAVAAALESVSLVEIDAQIAACSTPAMQVLWDDTRRQKVAMMATTMPRD
jgi:hypothetical protein